MPEDGMFRSTNNQHNRRLGGATGRGFMPGKSGNPGGRPRAAVNVQELARQHTEQAVRTLVEALRDPKLKVQAAQALLDRGWGRPPQTIHTEGQTSITLLHLAAAQMASSELISKLKPAATPIDDPNAIDLIALPPPAE
jgi:hypothetical protein